jgi:hypothetical protein
MLSKSESDKLLSIEATCRVLLEKCSQLRLETSAPGSPGASSKNTKKRLMDAEVEKYLTRNRERMFKKSLIK